MRNAALAFLLVIGASGCREGVGSHCTATADCKPGLACILPVGGTPQTGGVCSTIDAGVDIDFSVEPGSDGGDTDGGAIDASFSTDAGSDDLGNVDQGGPAPL